MRLLLFIFCLFCFIMSGYQSEYEEEEDTGVEGCLGGWTSYGDYCYKYFYDESVTWIKAEKICQSSHMEGGHLASIQSQDEMDLIYQMVLNEGTHWRHTDHFHRHNGESEHIWIGLVFWCTDQKQFKWTDGTYVNYTLASFNIKTLPPAPNHCGAFLLAPIGKQPSWHSQNCSTDAPFVCKVTKSNVTVTAKNDNEQDDLCDGWDWCKYDNKLCYKVQLTRQMWVDAQASCQKETGNLLSIHSKAEDIFFSQTLIRNYNVGTKFWTGFNKFETMDEMLRWSDGSILDYFPPLTVDFTQYRSSSCVYLKSSLYSKIVSRGSSIYDKTWDISRCDEKHMSICIKPFNVTAVELKKDVAKIAGGCNPGFVRYGNRCYKVFGNKNVNERTNFYSAQKRCYDTFGAHLVSIKDIFENYFVLSLLDSGQNQTWIGLISDAGDLKWIDQTPISFMSIDANTLSLYGWELDSTKSDLNPSPRSYYTTLVRNDRCFFMTIDKFPGRWDPVQTAKSITHEINSRRKRQDFFQNPYSRYAQPFVGDLCEKENLSFVCEQSVNASVKSFTNELACDYGNNTLAFKHGNGCYAFNFTRESWQSAENLCIENNGSLASLTSIYEFGFVASIAKNLGIKEFWIGLSDQKNLGRYLWSDEWPVHFTSWAQNEPSKNVMTQCVKMKLNDDVAGEWSSTECNNLLPYVCKKTMDPKPKPPAIEGRCEQGWHEGSTLCYKIHNELLKRTEAIVKCLREYHGATLAAFPSQEDVDSIIKNAEILNSKRRFFIGLLQKTHGGFEWLNNDPVSFVNWAQNKLQRQYTWTFGTTEVCVEMDQKGLWYGVSCYENRNFICSQPKQKLINVTTESLTTPSTLTSAPVGKKKQSKTESTSQPILARSTENSNPAITPMITAPPTTDHSNESLAIQHSLTPNKLLKPSKPASTNVGAAVGVTICVLFFILLLTIVGIFMYRRHRVGGGIFNWFRRSSAQMRFEVLNENDEM